MRLRRWISAVVIFVACVTVNLAGAESNLISMGVSYGNLLSNYPHFEVVASSIDCSAGEFGLLYIANQTQERKINEVDFIVNAKRDQLTSLFTAARQLAMSNQASFFGVSNLRENVTFRENLIYIETCGDLLALGKSAKK